MSGCLSSIGLASQCSQNNVFITINKTEPYCDSQWYPDPSWTPTAPLTLQGIIRLSHFLFSKISFFFFSVFSSFSKQPFTPFIHNVAWHWNDTKLIDWSTEHNVSIFKWSLYVTNFSFWWKRRAVCISYKWEKSTCSSQNQSLRRPT